jgi:hypothetical protein
MELKYNIEKMFPNINQPGGTTHRINNWKLLRMIYLMKKKNLYFRVMSLTSSLKN